MAATQFYRAEPINPVIRIGTHKYYHTIDLNPSAQIPATSKNITLLLLGWLQRKVQRNQTDCRVGGLGNLEGTTKSRSDEHLDPDAPPHNTYIGAAANRLAVEELGESLQVRIVNVFARHDSGNGYRRLGRLCVVSLNVCNYLTGGYFGFI